MNLPKRLIKAFSTILAGILISSTALMTAYAQSPGVGTWNSTSNLSSDTYAASTVEYNGYVYEIGGSTGLTIHNTVEYATLNSNGTVGTWNTTTVLPDYIEDATSIVANGYVYEIGGYDNSGFVNTVYYAYINADGTIGNWNTTTVLPDTIDDATSIVANGYVYEIGGSDNSGNIDTVYYAPLNSNGTVGTWSTTTALPIAGLEDASSVVYNGYVYELGGGDINNNNINTVYYAPLNSNGTVGTWNTTTVLPDYITVATSVVINGYIYEIGGSDNSGNIDTVYYAPLNSNGTVGTWSTTTALPNDLFLATSFVYNGNVYELGGGTNTIPTNTVYYAPITGYPLPDISNQTASVTSGSSVTVNVLNNVSGNPDLSTLSIISGPQHGTTTGAPGSITYTPNKDYVGTDSLVYQVCSLSNDSVCSQATLTFNVLASAVGTPDTGFGAPTANNTWITFAVYGTAITSLASLGFGVRRLHKLH